MRVSAHFYIIVTTLLLAAVAIMVFYNVAYPIVYTTVIIGQAWWILTVYKVLTNKYTTKKTFEDWYQDHPLQKD